MTAKTAQRTQPKIENLDARLEAVLEGMEPAPGEVCEYLISTARESRKECEELAKKIQECEQFLGQLRSKFMASQGVLQRAITDLKSKLRGEIPELHPVRSDGQDKPEEASK